MKIQCDRCNDVYNSLHDTAIDFWGDPTEGDLHLCMNCANVLYKWVKNVEVGIYDNRTL